MFLLILIIVWFLLNLIVIGKLLFCYEGKMYVLLFWLIVHSYYSFIWPSYDSMCTHSVAASQG